MPMAPEVNKTSNLMPAPMAKAANGMIKLLPRTEKGLCCGAGIAQNEAENHRENGGEQSQRRKGSQPRHTQRDHGQKGTFIDRQHRNGALVA